MHRRLPTLLLAALVVVTSVALGTCPVGRCAAMQAGADSRADASNPQQHDHAAMQHGDHGMQPASQHGDHGAQHASQHGDHGAQHAMSAPAPGTHDCCNRDGITAPSCCPDEMQLAGNESPASVERTSAGMALAATQPVPAGLAALPSATADPPRAAPAGTPPGTLIAQHTSLLV